ncbi:MAG: flavodoxin family protein [Saprospiraceae bacterium]|nr:flavodoxin family protein [Saprospiraceae bacterium]MCB9323827.1 flavodoxin family protein [Lewinellaceae bacterium]
MKKLIVQGSSRSDGNTHRIVSLFREETEADLLDLGEKNILPFDYDFNNQDDDFLPIIRDIADHYDLIIFATPVYWYTMSGLMKNFFDRLSDCLKIEKPTGRKLRGKSMALIICGSEEEEVPAFEMPFKLSAEYLGMNYLGYVHTWIEEDIVTEEVKQRVKQFARDITT